MNHFPVLLLRNLHAPCASRLQPHYNKICRDWGAKHNRTTPRATASAIAASKPDGSRRQSRKKTILKHFFKGIVKGKLISPKLRQFSEKSLSQPGCSHPNTIYNRQLQQIIVLRMQPRHHPNAICSDWVAKRNRTSRNGLGNCSSKTRRSRRQSRKKTILKHFLKLILKGKLLPPKLRKSADKSLSQPWCSHSNTIYDLQLQKTIVLRMQPLHQATLTQPLQCDLQRLSCKTQKNYVQWRRKLQLQNRMDLDAKATKRRFWSTF